MEQEAERNPYAPPVADVAPDGVPPKRRAWKAYFWFVVFISMLARANSWREIRPASIMLSPRRSVFRLLDANTTKPRSK